ncbi:type II secretion system protein GspI [Ectothiorhodospira shaposhnikovii]|uniref:type II secretion system minor pseudopilin GspI n=1 Tax=Ectothiorhodospira shaposhnikovii TaxID=1054 RepID=UPI001906A2E3|nr:type II secretion system minor pseudopilin GspI [Ectothiorhodospira shaposhnikovii]MBK1672917.1 type II secretion system protein GspI [Ectothiorhodospira shaposhnikovii]
MALRPQRGFTLLEVLVAVAVLAVALGAVIKLGSDNARIAAELRDRTHAHWVASNVMARYRAGLEVPAESVVRGSSMMAEREWYWEARLDPAMLDVGGFELGPVPRIEISVRDRDDPDTSPLARLVGYLNWQ